MVSVRISKRGDKYQYQFEIAKVNGKRKYINQCGFKTKAEAYEAGIKAFNEYQNAGVPFKECKMSYSDYLDYWVEHYCKTNLKYNTISTYETLINLYIKPKLGKYKLSTITSVAINDFISNLVLEKDLSRTYFKNILKVVKGSFRDACNLYGFIKYNPSLTIRLPKIDKVESDPKHYYTKEDIDKIITRFKDNIPFVCAFITSFYTGLRTGELFALTWDKIDLDNGFIYVENSIYDKKDDGKGRWYIGTTKTKTGTRKIYISELLKTALTNFKNRQTELKRLFGKDYKYYHIEEVKNEYGKVIEKRIVSNNDNEDKLDLVFTRDDGKFTGTDLIKYPFKIIHNELGLDNYRFYDLRGTYATNLLNNGTIMNEISELMGHSNPSITGKYYISTLEENKKEAINNLDKINNSDVINNIIAFEVQA